MAVAIKKTGSKESGKGASDGYISEMATFFHVMPGHLDQLNEACARFGDVIRGLDPAKGASTGLRDTRHVVYEDDTKLIWVTTFETDWDTYIDDALVIVGVEYFIDWMQHTVEADKLVPWFESFGGYERFSSDNSDNPDYKQNALAASQELKKIIQGVQVRANCYWNALSVTTLAEVGRANSITKAFDEVLDNPDAEEALSHPALKPLLDLASS